MEIREGQINDFEWMEAFVTDAISETFYKPDLSEDEIRSNQRIAQIAHSRLLRASAADNQMVFIAKSGGALAGFIVLADLDSDIPELDWLIVARKFQGKGIAQALMNMVLLHVPRHKKIKLGVIHYNERAKSFYRKYGFKDTGETSGNHLIPRTLMVRDYGGRS